MSPPPAWTPRAGAAPGGWCATSLSRAPPWFSRRTTCTKPRELADRLAILHSGRIVRTGTPEEVTAAQPARISFTLPADAPEPVPHLPGAMGTDGVESGPGRGVVVHTHNVQRTLTALLGWAGPRGVVLRDLNARSASLEEAFLAVTESAPEHLTEQEMAA
jgi:ABC-2 type transport system ATP-binding protein